MTTAPAFRTAERRARTARPPVPGLRAVLMEQVRATGYALRGAALIVAALVGLLTLVAWLQSVSMGAIRDFYESPMLLPGLMGALVPVAVWTRDDRAGHGYLWTLPVDRRKHVFTRVFAGWVWLMVAVVVSELWRPVLTLASGGGVLAPETLSLATSPIPATGPVDYATLKAVRWVPGPLIWLVPFTGATTTYLLSSAVVLGSRHPLRWVIGTVLVYSLLLVGSGAVGTQFKMEWLVDGPGTLHQRLIQGRYGLDAVLTARTGTLSTVAFLTTGERALVWRAVPDLDDWRTATVLWASVGLVALWAAASRHRERRRS